MWKVWTAAGDSADIRHRDYRFFSLFYVRMTSCVLSLFFLFFLCSSITVVDPTGLKVRITNRAQDVLKDLGLCYFEDLVNKRFADRTLLKGLLKVDIKQLMLTHLSVNPAHVHFSFQQNSGLFFQIKRLDFTGHLHRDIRLFNIIVERASVVFGGRGVSADISVKLIRNQQGRLNVQLPYCQVRADKIIMKSSSFLGKIFDFFIKLFKNYFTSQICTLIHWFILPEINSNLEKMTMVTRLPGDHKLSIDYSLSGDMAVTSNSIDIPFKGLVFIPGNSVKSGVIIKGVDPQITENNLMAYVGVSDFVLKSAAQSLYRPEPFLMAVPKLSSAENSALTAVGLPVGPLHLTLTDVPSILISQSGLSVKVNARAQSLVQPRPPALPLTCKVAIKVSISEHRLILLSNNVKCDVKPTTLTGIFWKVPVNIGISKQIKFEIHKLFGTGTGLLIPLPEGIDFTQGKVDYHEGFLVVGGNLKPSAAARKKLLQITSR